MMKNNDPSYLDTLNFEILRGIDDEGEDVSSYWRTLRKRKDTGN
jgi:hypothetical protein